MVATAATVVVVVAAAVVVVIAVATASRSTSGARPGFTAAGVKSTGMTTSTLERSTLLVVVTTDPVSVVTIT